MSNRTPIRVDASFTPSGTQDVNIVSSIVLNIAAASLPLPTGAATEATLFAAKLDLDKFTFLSTRLLVDGSGVVQPVSGTVTANQGTSPWVVSGTITTSPDVNIHDSAGNNLSSTGTSLDVNVTNTVPVTGPLTDAELRASPVPISGTVTSNQGTSPWVVSGTVTANLGTIDGAATEITLAAIKAQTDLLTFSATRLLVDGSGTIQPVSGTVAVSNFPAIQTVAISQSGTNNDVDATIVNASIPVTQSGVWSVGRTWTLSSGTDSVSAAQSGTWNINNITGTVSLPTGAATEATLLNVLTTAAFQARINTLGQKTMANSTPVVLASDQTAIPVSQSGSWSVSGTGNFTVVQPTGTNLHTVLDSGTLTSITNALPAGTNVIGHVITDSGSTTAVTGNVTVVQPTGTNLHTVVDSGSITVNNAAGASAVNIQDGGNTITVDGTVTANQGTANTVANGWPVKITDGTDTAAVDPLGGLFVGKEQRLFTINNKTYGNAFEINAATAGSDNPAILIRNPNGSGKIAYFYLVKAGVQINNVFITYKIFANPTITTNGTTQTPQSLNVGGGAGAASILINTLPTVSASGTALVNGLMSQNGTSVTLTEDGIIGLNPNNNLLITANPQSNNRVSAISIQWVEV